MNLLPFRAALLVTALAVWPGQSHAARNKQEIRGNCALVLKMGEWSEKIVVPAAIAADEPSLDLSDKKTFMHVQQQPDGSEHTRQGSVPPQLVPYNIRVLFEQDEKSGWPGHEELGVSVTIFERKRRTQMQGPFRGSLIRKIQESRETTEDMPFVSGVARIGAEKLEFQFGCSKALGT